MRCITKILSVSITSTIGLYNKIIRFPSGECSEVCIFQLPPYAQAKLVTVIKGKVLDVVVDIRSGSKTFGKVYYCTRDSEKRNMLMVPEGFAHGFSALEDTLFAYKCTNTYNLEVVGGIVWNDPDLRINWQNESPIVSEKDSSLPTLAELMRKSVILQ